MCAAFFEYAGQFQYTSSLLAGCTLTTAICSNLSAVSGEQAIIIENARHGLVESAIDRINQSAPPLIGGRFARSHCFGTSLGDIRRAWRIVERNRFAR